MASRPESPRPSLTLGVIPARYGSSRFPGKPLALLWGKPLLQHVWERGRTIEQLDSLVVATDDLRIAEAARGFGAEVEMTATTHESGTDRVAEVARRRPSAGIIANLQGDEPELDAASVAVMVEAMRYDPRIRLATLAHVETDAAVLASPEVVKLEVDGESHALYFTRGTPRAGGRVLRHIGIYGFDRDFLLEFASWPPGESEQRERLEQLRALERGVSIRVFLSGRSSAGIDSPEQLAELERRGPSSP